MPITAVMNSTTPPLPVCGERGGGGGGGGREGGRRGGREGGREGGGGGAVEPFEFCTGHTLVCMHVQCIHVNVNWYMYIHACTHVFVVHLSLNYMYTQCTCTYLVVIQRAEGSQTCKHNV